MKKSYLLVATLLLSVVTIAQNPKKFYRKALKAYENKVYFEAISNSNKAIEIDAKYADAYALRGKIYEKNNELEKAKSDFEKAALLMPNAISNLLNAGKINYKLQDYNQAILFLNKVVLYDETNFQALQYKAFTHIKLAEYHEAINAINKAININKTYLCLYTKGVANDSLKNYSQAIANYSEASQLNPNYPKVYFALSLAYAKNNQLDKAINLANLQVSKFSENPDAYLSRSIVYHQHKEYEKAINDLSKALIMVKENDDILLTRGIYYFDAKQYQNAKADFSELLKYSDNQNIKAFYWRARANAKLTEKEMAKKDFYSFLNLLSQNPQEDRLKEDVEKRLFELNRENVAPEILIENPMPLSDNYLGVLNKADRITLKGRINDQSDIESFMINNKKIDLKDKKFAYNMSIAGLRTLSFLVIDVYGNKTATDYFLKDAEINSPQIAIQTPYASDNGEIYLDSNDDNLFIEGKIEDESKIKEIFVDGVRASFNDSEINPIFTATINIKNKESLEVVAVDIFNNKTKKTFTINRSGTIISQSNPMGKTWIVFIENSNYDTFASLEGPTKDVTTMKAALSNYEVHNFIHKKDMSKKDMERFFSIELRDQVKKNNVNSLLVWYAGHGKMIDETGYWIPIDATRDDEFTYFNINALKAGMQSYSNLITHTLVITDACESGPSFYQAMRADKKIRSCSDVTATKFKSSQVFSSSGYELASDNSQFTKTFAKSLEYNKDACMPIESVVLKVTKALTNANQKPKFGKISGLEDENGTFFFIKK